MALRRGRHGVARSHRLRYGLAAAVIVVAVVVTAGWMQLARSLPAPVVHAAVTLASDPVPGVAPTLPWPPTGQAAVAVAGRGLLLQSGPETPVPVASLVKVMTALLVLRDHPLNADAPGPGLTIAAGDQNEAAADEAGGDTSVPVKVGEVLTERQLLDGLLVHSANNFADILAAWDAGSVPLFVARMNTVAAALGMRATHYADTSGLSPFSVSTAGDQLRVALAAMAVPAFAAVVAQPSVSLPIAGVMQNYVHSVGRDGVIGVKSGFTQAAMGCLVLAADRPVGGRTVLVLAAVTGQPGLNPLQAADATDVSLVDAVARSLRERPVLARHAQAATVVTPWQAAGVPADTERSVTLLAWPGDAVRVTFVAAHVRIGARAGVLAGTIVVSDGAERVEVPVRTAAPVTAPPLSWRLRRG